MLHISHVVSEFTSTHLHSGWVGERRVEREVGGGGGGGGGRGRWGGGEGGREGRGWSK